MSRQCPGLGGSFSRCRAERAGDGKVPNLKPLAPGKAQTPGSKPFLPQPARFGAERFSIGLVLSLAIPCLAPLATALPFHLPTANHALFEPGGEEKFFVGTAGKPWTTGAFGCVRSDGRQLHEGLDIRCLQRDQRGEPTDPVMATADGTVAYISRRPALSNYGTYLVLRHQVEGLEIYSLYA